MLGRFGLFAADKDFHFGVGTLGHSQVRLGAVGTTHVFATGAASMASAPSVSPGLSWAWATSSGLRLAALQFSGGVLAWGLMVPLLMYFLGPQLQAIPSGRYAGQLGDHGGGGVAIYCAADRRGRNVGGRGVHAVTKCAPA